MPLLDRLRSRFRPSSPVPSRRDFFRRAGGLGAGMALGGGLLLPEEAWAGVEERAARFGITPGTVVDAQGRPMKPSRQSEFPLLGEIMIVGFNFAPRNWALCDGQILSINSNQSLFSLLGTTFGGDGRTTFGLPDLRGRFPAGQGTGPGLSTMSWGEKGGQENVTMTTAQMPQHSHTLGASSSVGTTDAPANAFPARPASSIPQYAASSNTTLANTGNTGSNQSQNNMPPYLGLYFCIATVGTFPSRP